MLRNLLLSPAYWWLLLIGVICAEGVALYYQYVLDFGPCVLCIHIRLWLFALAVIAVVALLGFRFRFIQSLCHPLALLTAIGFAERSWRVLAVERLWIESSCTLESGLPTWFTPDQWWPWMFEIWEACGYTPMVGPFSMAEWLFGASIPFVLLTLMATGRHFVTPPASN